MNRFLVAFTVLILGCTGTIEFVAASDETAPSPFLVEVTAEPTVLERGDVMEIHLVITTVESV